MKLSTPVLRYNAYELRRRAGCAPKRISINRFLWRLQSDIKIFRSACKRVYRTSHLSHVRRLNKHDRRRHHREEIRAGSWLKLAAHLESKGLKWKKTRSPGDACRRNERDRTEGGREGEEKGMEARTKSAERSAANPGSAKRYRIFAPFCGSGKRAEKNRCSREKIGLRLQAGRKNRAGGGEGGGGRAGAGWG